MDCHRRQVCDGCSILSERKGGGFDPCARCPPARLTGFVWGENVGWINLDDTTHFVSVDAASSPIACDTNHDGLVNGGDVQSFIDFVLLNSSPDWRDVCSGDVEAAPDKVIELDDVANFVDCLLM